MSFTIIKNKDLHKHVVGVSEVNNLKKEFNKVTISGIQETIQFKDYFQSSIAINFASHINKSGEYEVINTLNGLTLFGLNLPIKLRLKDFKAINDIMEKVFEGTHNIYDYKSREYISELSEKRNLFLLNIYNYKKNNGLKIDGVLIDFLSDEMMI